ncbi:protein FAR1-RELATED SEQUENCE [Trifolium repens]|nr:protein FAR1-RELATED SEQUENCE [Trifolium repens]
MAEAPAQLNEQNDDPRIGNEVVAAPVDEPIGISINTGNLFLNAALYNDRDELIDWCRQVALNAGFSMEPKRKLKRDDTATRKCDCPFRLRGYFLATKKWKLSVVNGEHNHEMAKNLEGHILAGRLKPEEKECVHQMTRNLVAPKTILNTLREKNKDSKTNMKQIYNERQRYKRDLRGEMTEIQQLLKCLESHRYFHKFRTNGESTSLQDIFFAHPDSVKLLNTFPTVLLMDSTYKTNKYKMPLFEIVGVTSTQLTFNVAYAFLTNEREDNFKWALEACRSLLKNNDGMPKVIVTDRDKSLMNAVETVFPRSTALVCRYHVFKNVRAKLKDLCKAKDKKLDDLLETLRLEWDSLVESSSEEEYGHAVVKFRRVFEKFPKFLNYVEETVLDPVKEKLVRAWTDKVMHIGNTTTNRVESQHDSLKEYIKDCKGDLVFCWDAINQMLANQFTQIKTSFGHSTTSVEHSFKDHFLYSKLLYNVSREGLKFIRGEEVRSRECGRNRKKCGCVIKRTYGLPCACLIALKIERKLPIRLDEVNIHWKRLQYEEGGESDVSCLEELNAIQERFKLADHDMKLQIKEELRLIAYPETTSVNAPAKKCDTKGAKKRRRSAISESSSGRTLSHWEHIDRRIPDSQGSQSKPSRPKKKTARIGRSTPVAVAVPTKRIRDMRYMPRFMHEYIEDIIDVAPDGHCGFRVVAQHLGKGQDSQGLIRLALIRELTMFRSDYLRFYESEERLQYVLDGLHPPKIMPKSGVAPKDKWFTFPDMGHLVATVYGRVVVELTSPTIGFSETFFPVRGRPPADPFSKIMCLGLIPNHFVEVKLKPGCPLPPPAKSFSTNFFFHSYNQNY